MISGKKETFLSPYILPAVYYASTQIKLQYEESEMICYRIADINNFRKQSL